MKKILLIIILISAILQLVVLATAISIGCPDVINRDTPWPTSYTLVDNAYPADETGTITSIDIWASADITGLEVATFYVVSGNNLSTRDTEAIPGTITAGSKVTKTVNLDVVVGDYIGMCYTGGSNDTTYTSAGIWYVAADKIPCTNQAFTLDAAHYRMSLHGTGATAAPPAAGNAIMMGINF